MRIKKLRRLQNLPLYKKVKLSKLYIEKYIKDNNGMVYGSFSGGKDSTILKDLYESVDSSIPSVFCNTTNEQKEILEFVKKQDNVVYMLPKMGFVKIIKNYGFPMISKMTCRKINTFKKPTDKNIGVRTTWSDKKSKFALAEKYKFLIDEDFDITSKCCDILKKEPFRRYEKETSRKPISGIMTDESKQREESIINGGIINNNTCCPLAFWKEQDIWDYAKINNIRFSENYYDRIFNNTLVFADKRSGCEYCLMGFKFDKSNLFSQNRLEKAKIVNPKKFNRIMSIKNNGISFSEAIKKVYSIRLK